MSKRSKKRRAIKRSIARAEKFWAKDPDVLAMLPARLAQFEATHNRSVREGQPQVSGPVVYPS